MNGGVQMDGIIPLYKERGMTSFDCVSRLRRILHTKKIGHSGTLDPNVDGVLPICVGNGTKVVEYLMNSEKEYVGEVLIGQATTTEDLDGELVETKTVPQAIPAAQIQAVMDQMTGQITQIPPMYSAVKVKGKRLYEYARAGETVERPQRQVTISSFRLISTDYDESSQTQRARFVVACSKGTYVRTLAVDLAKQLGYPGVMSQLTRKKSGGFEIDQTLSLADVQDMVSEEMMGRYIYPVDYALKDLPHHELSADQWSGVQNGVWLKANELSTDAKRVVLTYRDDAKAIYQYRDQVYKPEKMISTK